MLHEPFHRITASGAAQIDLSGAVIVEVCGLCVEAGTADEVHVVVMDVLGLEPGLFLRAPLRAGVNVADGGDADLILVDHRLLVDAQVAHAEVTAADEADFDPVIGAEHASVGRGGEHRFSSSYLHK